MNKVLLEVFKFFSNSRKWHVLPLQWTNPVSSGLRSTSLILLSIFQSFPWACTWIRSVVAGSFSKVWAMRYHFRSWDLDPVGLGCFHGLTLKMAFFCIEEVWGFSGAKNRWVAEQTWTAFPPPTDDFTTSRNGILHLEAMSKPKKDAWEHGTPWDIMGYYGQVSCSASFQRLSTSLQMLTFNKPWWRCLLLVLARMLRWVIEVKRCRKWCQKFHIVTSHLFGATSSIHSPWPYDDMMFNSIWSKR